MKEQYRCVRVWTLGKVWEDLSLELTAVGLRWRKETMKTGIRIQNISEKPARKIFSTRSQRIFPSVEIVFCLFLTTCNFKLQIAIVTSRIEVVAANVKLFRQCFTLDL